MAKVVKPAGEDSSTARGKTLHGSVYQKTLANLGGRGQSKWGNSGKPGTRPWSGDPRRPGK